MTVLATKVETSNQKAQNAGSFKTKCPSSFGRVNAGWSAVGGVGLALLAPLLMPIAVLAGATAAAGRSIGARLERSKIGSLLELGKRPPGGGGGGAIGGWPRGGSGFPQKIPQKIFGAFHPWRRF